MGSAVGSTVCTAVTSAVWVGGSVAVGSLLPRRRPMAKASATRAATPRISAKPLFFFPAIGTAARSTAGASGRIAVCRAARSSAMLCMRSSGRMARPFFKTAAAAGEKALRSRESDSMRSIGVGRSLPVTQ